MRIQAGSASWRSLVQGVATLCIVGFAVVILHRILTSVPDSEYVHRLVTYEGGVVRRGLVGEIYSWFLPVVPPEVVRIEGFAAVGFVLVLFGIAFRRTFPNQGADVALMACFLIGSPLLFKNFIGNLGKFDPWGAAVAMLALLLPLTRGTIVLVGLLSVVLLFMHHLHATIYVPAVYAILFIRMVGARRGFDPADAAALGLSLALLAGVFLALLVLGVPTASPETFLDAMRGRSLQTFPDFHVSMWYSTVGEEASKSLVMLPQQLLRLPIYAAFVLIHLPAILFFARRLGPLRRTHRASHQAFLLAAAVVVAGYALTNIVTFDYARHLGNLAMCLLLMAMAQLLATTGPVEDVRDLDPTDRPTLLAATTVAVLPWTGTVFPLI